MTLKYTYSYRVNKIQNAVSAPKQVIGIILCSIQYMYPEYDSKFQKK